MGLVEKEWLDTLATINPDEVTYLIQHFIDLQSQCLSDFVTITL